MSKATPKSKSKSKKATAKKQPKTATAKSKSTKSIKSTVKATTKKDAAKVSKVSKKEEAKIIETPEVKKTVVKKAQRVITKAGLRKFNLFMAALHAIQAVAVIVLSKPNAWPINTSYLTLDTYLSTNERPVLTLAQRTLFDINLAYVVAAFFVMSALAHLIIATVYRNRYESDLDRGVNKARWIEYSFSASTMMVGIGLLSGIYDLSTLIGIFSLVAVMNLMGLVMEIHNQTTLRTNWLSYVIGCIAGIIPWIIFAIYVWGATVYGQEGVPGFVYGIYVSIFLFFNCFAVNMYLQYKKVGRWSNYLYGERAYIILSLVAKSALAWQVFGGTLRP